MLYSQDNMDPDESTMNMLIKFRHRMCVVHDLHTKYIFLLSRNNLSDSVFLLPVLR